MSQSYRRSARFQCTRSAVRRREGRSPADEARRRRTQAPPLSSPRRRSCSPVRRTRPVKNLKRRAGMPSNVARALSATPITRARSNESSYWNVTLTPITAPPVACPQRGATDRCDPSPSGGHGQARPAGQRAAEILKARPPCLTQRLNALTAKAAPIRRSVAAACVRGSAPFRRGTSANAREALSCHIPARTAAEVTGRCPCVHYPSTGGSLWRAVETSGMPVALARSTSRTRSWATRGGVARR